jgi:hypothetical protein
MLGEALIIGGTLTTLGKYVNRQSKTIFKRRAAVHFHLSTGAMSDGLFRRVTPQLPLPSAAY